MMAGKVLFLCAHDWANVAYRLTEAINEYTDWGARCVVNNPHEFGYKQDLPCTEENKDTILQLMDECDFVIHGSSFFDFFPWNHNVNHMAYRGVWHGGSAYRSNHDWFNSNVHMGQDIVFAHRDLVTLDQQNLLLQAPYDTHNYKRNLDFDGPIVIGHSPSNTDVKGTQHFLNNIKRLKDEYGDQVEFVVLQNMNNEQVLKEKSRCHIFFDQIGQYPIPEGGTKGYGVSLIESASYGSVCLAWSEYPDTPIIPVQNSEHIFQVCSKLISDRKLLKHYSDWTLDWVRHEHGYKQVSTNFISALENIIASKDPFVQHITKVRTQFSPLVPLKKGMLYIRDIPQLQNPDYKWDQFESSLLKQCTRFLGPTESFCKLVNSKIFPDNPKPYLPFATYPQWLPFSHVTRNEVVYIDNASMSFNNFERVVQYLAKVQESIKLPVLYVTKNYPEQAVKLCQKYGVNYTPLQAYDYGSRYGLLTPTLPNPDYTPYTLSRKLFTYLTSGMVPLVHSDFTESINYLQREKCVYIVYNNTLKFPKDLLQVYPEHNWYNHTLPHKYLEQYEWFI